MDFGDLPKAGSKDAMRDALRAYEEAHPEKCILIPSEDQFYGFTKGSNRLARYVQWVYVPAVKDATKENVEGKNTALGKILARTVRAKVKFDEEISKLKDDTTTFQRR
jgi:putative ATP-dependent endonuclease of OLD family